MSLESILLLLTSFILVSIVVDSTLKVTELGNSLSNGLRLGLSLGFSPLLLSFVLSGLFFVLPNQSVAVYVSALVVVFLTVFWFSKKNSSNSIELIKSEGGFSAGFGKPIDAVLVTIILAALLTLFLSVLTIPLYSNDPLEYFKTAQVLSDKRDLFFYPVSDITVGNGFYGPWTHPPGYTSMLVWGIFVDSVFNAVAPGSGRFIAWYYCCASVLLLLAWTRNKGLVACVFFLAAPIYFAGVSSSHIDAPRVFPILATFVVFQQGLVSSSTYKSLGFLAVSAMCLASCFFMHSIGMLIAPIWGVLFLVLFPGKLLEKITRGCIVACILLVIVTPFLVSNYQTLGRVLSDTPEVWALEEIRHQEFIAAQRSIDSFNRKIFNGIIKGWSKPRSFGFMYWAAMVGTLLFLFEAFKRRKNDFRQFIGNHSVLVTNVGVIVVYFAMTIVATLLGSDAFIKNDRYLLTIHPFVALVAAVGAVRIVKGLFNDKP